MTDHTNLISLLRVSASVIAGQAADALEALQDQLDIQAGSIEAVQAANQRLAAEVEALKWRIVDSGVELQALAAGAAPKEQT